MTYIVELANEFNADTPEGAVGQMAAWVSDYGYEAGYRVTCLETGTSVFIDAESIDFDALDEEIH